MKSVDIVVPAAAADAKAAAKTQTNSAIPDTTNHKSDDSITLSVALNPLTIRVVNCRELVVLLRIAKPTKTTTEQ
eukprot:16430936-Heterocapsa_arctica.AAC.1